MLGPVDYQKENVTLTETEQTTQEKNHFLDEYNGKPTLEKIQKIIAQKRAAGELDRKIWVDVGWALDKEEFFITQTNYTWAAVQNAPHQLYQMQQNMLIAQDKANLEHRKCQELLLENAIVYERLNQISEENKEKESTITQKLASSRIVKLPISKVKTFLAFCEDSIEDFYIKIDDNGNMQRIVRKLEEL